MHYVSPINGYEKGHKQLIILKKRRKRTSLKNAVFVRQVVLFSTDSVPMKKNGENQDGSDLNVLGRARPRARAAGWPPSDRRERFCKAK